MRTHMQVVIAVPPAAGEYTITVAAVSISFEAGGPQFFSLVALHDPYTTPAEETPLPSTGMALMLGFAI